MLTTTLVSGHLLFADRVSLPESAKIRLKIVDITDPIEKVLVEENPAFDARLLSVFKYLPFEVKNFELEKGRSYRLKVHVDLSGKGTLQKGDFVSVGDLNILTGLEEFDVSLTKVE